MKKKVIVVALIIVAAIMILCGGLYWQKHTQVAQQSADVVSLLRLLKSDELSFEGTMELASPQNIKIDFTTSLQKENGQTAFSIRLPRGDKQIELKGDLVTTTNASYLKLSNATEAARSLPNDPLSRAIKNNLISVANEFEGSWIKLKDSQAQKTACASAITQLAQIEEETLATAYKKFPIIKKIEREGQTVVLSFNENSSQFMREVFNEKTPDCSLDQITLKLTKNEAGSEVEELHITDQSQSVRIFNIKKQATEEVVIPQKSIPFIQVEQRISSLFIP